MKFVSIITTVLSFVALTDSANPTNTTATASPSNNNNTVIRNDKINKPPEPVFVCPPQAELELVHCQCYPTLQYLICDGTSNVFTLAGQNNASTHYWFKTLTIKDSAQLPFWNEHLKDRFRVQRLVILQNDSIKLEGNLNELLRLPETEFKIVSSSNDNNRVESLDWHYLSRGLRSVSIDQVARVEHRYDANDHFLDMTQLRRLQFRGVHFSPPIADLFLRALPLTFIEFTNTSLSGKFAFVPAGGCSTNGEPLEINLSDNNQLTDFPFDTLFSAKETEQCVYHIDLSNNSRMRSDLIVSQLDTLEKYVGRIVLRLDNIPLDCNCRLYQLYRSNRLHRVLHGVNCNTFGLLDYIEKDSQKASQICPH